MQYNGVKEVMPYYYNFSLFNRVTDTSHFGRLGNSVVSRIPTSLK